MCSDVSNSGILPERLNSLGDLGRQLGVVTQSVADVLLHEVLGVLIGLGESKLLVECLGSVADV